MSTLFVALLASVALAGDPKKVSCPGPDGKITRYIYKDCGAQFELYARDISGGLSVDVGAMSGTTQVSSTVVQLAMDEINKELRTSYVAACTLATTDPCGPGMDAFQHSVAEISMAYPRLRERASKVQSTADADAIGDAVRAALAEADAPDAALTERIDRALGGSSSPSGDLAANEKILGSWNVAFEAPSSCTGENAFVRRWTIANGTFAGTYSVTFETNDHVLKEMQGKPVGDELALVSSETRPSYPWTEASARVDSSGRLVGTARIVCDGMLSATATDFRLAGTRQ